MSNCIIFDGGLVSVPGTRIQYNKLRALQEKAEALPVGASPKWEADPDLYFAYWFLCFGPKSNREEVVLHLGGGLSGHTWRDLRAFIKWLSGFVVPGEEITRQVVARDEFDNFERAFPLKIDLSAGAVG